MKKNFTSIEAVYYTPSIIIEKKLFSSKSKFKEIINYFNLNIKPNNNNLELKKQYNYKQNKINESTNIKELIDIKTKATNDIPNIFIELDDSNDINESRNYILKPKNNPFGIISFSVKTNSISSENFPNDMIQLNNLDKYHPEFGAYCNSYDSLFISGGNDQNKQPIDDFWEIGLNLNNISVENKIENKYQIKHLKMLSNKKQHSMLYNIKDNSIIILGGNDKKCFIYNINTGTFSQLPEMNDVHISPALLIYNNYLYAFGSFARKINYFEKLDLTRSEKWEKLSPENYFMYSNKSFGVCHSSQDDKILILGGERIGYYTILYDIMNNSLLKSKGKDQSSKLNDKTFYKLNNSYYANISDTKENSLIIVNTSTNDVKKVNFDKNGKADSNFWNNEESDISIEPKLEDKIISKGIHISNLKDLNHRNEDNITSQNYSNDFNNNIPEKITLRTNNKKTNLKLIKEFSGNDNFNDNNKNVDNNDIVINNEINIDNGLQNFEIKIEQEAKVNDMDKDKNILIRAQKHPKFLISTPSLNDQLTNILVEKEDKSEEEKVQDKKEDEFANLKNEEKKENILLKSDDKFKSPTKFKLNQTFGIDNYSNYRQNSNNRSTSSKNKLAKSMYLNIDDDVKYYSNNDFDNYLFRRMAPHYKKENKLNSSSAFDIRIKNPIVKSKKIKRRKVNGQNYSVLLEKIIDRDNLSLYENYNMNDSYTYKNNYDNHKLYISQYIKNGDDDEDLLDQRNLTQQAAKKYKTLYDIPQKYNKIDKRKKPNNIVITNPNNNRKYNVKKILNKNNYENAKFNENEFKINDLNNNNNYYQNNKSNNSESRNILKSKNEKYSISPFDDIMKIRNNSKNEFDPMKSTASGRKKNIINEMNDKNINNNNVFYPDKNEYQIFDIGNKYIENESVNINNFEDNYNDNNNEPIIKKVDYSNNKNNLPLLINNNYYRSSKKNNNNKVINTYGNEPKEDNIQNNSDRFKSGNIGLDKMESEQKRKYILKTSQNENENENENISQPFNNFSIYESSNKKHKNNEDEEQNINEIKNYVDYKDNDNENNNNNENQSEEINEIKNSENEKEDDVNQNNYNQNINNDFVNDFNERNNDFNNKSNKSIDMNISHNEKENKNENENENENQISNQSNNKSIDLNNYKEQEPENVKVITNIDNNTKQEEKTESNINIDKNDINHYKPEKKEIKINLDDIKIRASNELVNNENSNERNNMSENIFDNNNSHNDGNIYRSNKELVNSNNNFEEKENSSNSGAILGNGPATINTKMILNNTKEQASQDNEPNEYSALNNITKAEIYQKENEDYNLIDTNKEQPLGINNEELINAIKKKITKLINVKNGEYSLDDNNDDNNDNIDINNNPIIELESSFREKEEEPTYKVKNKKISEIQFCIPKYSIEEQIFRREVILNQKDNENEAKINDTNENKDEINNEVNHQEKNNSINEEEMQNKSIEDTKSINDENKNKEHNKNNENVIIINNKENSLKGDDMINNKENSYKGDDMINNNENEYKNNDMINNYKNEYKNNDMINNYKNELIENDDMENNIENESIEKSDKVNNKENELIEQEYNKINNKENELIEKEDNKINNKENELIEKEDNKINNKENEIIEKEDNNTNNKENEFIENYGTNNNNNKENKYIENDENNNNNNKDNEYIEIDEHNNTNNKENEYFENDEHNNNKENENKYDNFEHNQIINKNKNENMNNDENISITNNIIIYKNQNGNNIREKLFKNNQKIEINKKKKKILNKDINEFVNNNDDMMNKNEKVKIDFDEEQNKDIFFNDKIENEENPNNSGNEEVKSFKENEIIKMESEPIIENDTRQKIKKPKIHLIIDESNILNQITSIVIIKEEDNNKNENEKENKNENENIDDKNEVNNNNEKINKDNNDMNDNNYSDNKNRAFKENINNDKFEQSNDSLEEIDLIANHPIKKNINESENSFVEIDIIGNNKIDKNEIKNSDLNNPSLLRRKNQIKEKDLNDDNNNEKILLKRKNQINENNMEINDSEIFNENIPNRINISKVTKLHDHPYLTLYELMDEPSNKKIDLNFYEIKDIVFTKEDLNQNFNKNIKTLIRKGIPKTFIAAKKPKLKSIYTPQKIKMGKKTFMIKKKNMNNNNNNNRDKNERGTFEFNNYNTENLELKKNINMLEDKSKKNIASLKYTNLNNKLNKKIIYEQNDDNLLYKNITDTNIKNIVKNRYDENDMTDNDQNEISEAIKRKQNSNYYVNLKSVPNLNSIADKRSISPLFKKKINISKGKKLNNLGGNKIKKDN